jgi:outer membrane protein
VSAALLAVVAAVLAQGEGPVELSMEDAVRLALAQNRSVLQAQEAVAAAQAALERALAAQRFTIAGQATVVQQEPTAQLTFPVPTGQPVSVTIRPKVMWQTGLAVTQPIYHGGRLYYQEVLARLGLDVAVLQRQQQERQVVRQVRALYLGALQAQQLEEVARENAARAARHLEDARARVAAGAAPGFDVIRAEAEVANAQDGVVAAEAAVDKTLAALKTLLAIDVTRPVRLQPPPASSIGEVDVHRAIAVALEHRPEVKAADRAVQMAAASVGMARASKRPSVDLAAGYQKVSSAGFAGHTWSWNLGVQAQQVIFDHGLTAAAVAEAQAKQRQAEEMAKQVREGVALEVYQAWVSLREAQEKIAAAEKGVAQAEEALRIAELRYREGLSAAVEATDARAALIAARANLVNARFAYEQAKVDLEFALGVELGQFLGAGGEQPAGRESEPAGAAGQPGRPEAAGGESGQKAAEQAGGQGVIRRASTPAPTFLTRYQSCALP